MAINLATKYASNVADKFYHESFVAGKSSREYSFNGVKTVTIPTITTVAPTDYTRSGSDRFGSINEVEDTKQDLTITQDKAVALSIDKGNNTQQMMIKNAGKVMNLEIREQFVPAMDKYCLNAWASFGGVQTVEGKLTKANIVEEIAKGIAYFTNNLVPLTNIYLYIGATQFAKLVTSPEFLNLEKLGTKAVEKGEVGMVHGAKVIVVPDSYLPSQVNFMLVKKECVVVPFQIKDMKIHEDAPGISGALLEVRWLYDAFVIDAKKQGIYVNKETL